MSEVTPQGTPAPGAAQVLNTTAPQTPTPAAAPTPAQPTWFDGFDPELKGYVQNKQFKDPGDLAKAYWNLEKLRGVPQERLITLPEKADDPAWGDIYDRLGRPKDPNGYEFKQPEGMESPEFLEWSKKTMHELGIPKRQAEQLVSKWNEFVMGSAQKEHETMQQEFQVQDQTLKREWGMAYDQNVQVASNATKGLGVSPDQVEALEQVLGFGGVMKLFHQIGSKFSEGTFVAPSSNNGFSAMTPEAAQQRIMQLRQDSNFVSRLLQKDADAKNEWDRLHQMLSPG